MSGRPETSDQWAAPEMAGRWGEAAALHLEIRRWQEATDQNQFADTGELAGFVGLKNTGNGTGSL